jgi:hypothetical protein
MKTILCCAVLCLVSSTGLCAFSLPASQQQYATRCVHAILNGSYGDALSIADSAIAADRQDPLAPLLYLTAIGIRDVDFDTLLDTASFFRAYRLTEERITSWEHKNGISSYCSMLSGFCKGIHSSFYLRQESYYAAMQTGFEALRLLEDSYKLDSSNVEPLFFLGLYDYARGELKKRLWWVLFWYPGSKKEGIRRLWCCADKGMLTGKGALFALADIYTRENMPGDAAPVVESLRRDFPQSRFALWARAKHLESKHSWYEAALVYEQLAASYGAHRAGAHNAFVTANQQAHLLARAGQKKEAAAVCRMLLDTPVSKKNRSLHKDTEKLLAQISG